MSRLPRGLAPRGAGKNAAEHLRALPDDVHCEQQRALYEPDFPAGPLGTVDLSFRGARGWQLICELKINSRYERTQLQRYIKAGVPFVSVVRQPGSADPNLQRDANWLGEVAWSDIRPGLERLRLPQADAKLWRDILELIASDGDFDPKRGRPKPSAADEALVSQVRRTLTMALARVLSGHRDEDTKAFLDGLQSPVQRRNSDWVGVELRQERRDHLVMSVWLRHAASQSPEVEIWWDAPGRSVARSLSQALRQEHFGPYPRDDDTAPQWFSRRTVAVADVLSKGAPAAVMSTVTKALIRLDAIGAFDDYLL